MADKKKNTGQEELVPASTRSQEKERSKSTKAVTRERDERKVRESKAARSSSSGSSKQSPTALRFRNNRIVRFVREAYYELRYKVTWPTFIEARNMTFVVIVLSAAIGLFLGLADLGLFQLFRLITGGS